jgi:hypothetical protein
MTREQAPCPCGRVPAQLLLRANDKTLLTCGYGMFLRGCSRVKRADLPAFWVVWGSSGSVPGRGGCAAAFEYRG